MRVPFVKPCEPRPEALRWYVNEVFKNSHATPAGLVDEDLRKQQLTLERPKKSQGGVQAKNQEQTPAWSDFLGKE
jgi:hypothetical protein